MNRRGSSPLEERRCRMSTSQLELSGKTGVPQPVISLIESGKQRLTLNNAEKLSSYLDICPYQLVLENSFWLATNHDADFSTCEEIGVVMGKRIRRLPESQRQVGLEFACNFGKARSVLGEAVTSQFVTEHAGRAPSILLSPEETKVQLAANAQIAQHSQARRQAEGTGYTRSPSILLRDREPFQIKEKLAKRPGVFVPTPPPLTTAQRQNTVERVQPAPPILLANVDEPKPTKQELEDNELEQVNDEVPPSPPILTKPPKGMTMHYNRYTVNGDGDE